MSHRPLTIDNYTDNQKNLSDRLLSHMSDVYAEEAMLALEHAYRRLELLLYREKEKAISQISVQTLVSHRNRSQNAE